MSGVIFSDDCVIVVLQYLRPRLALLGSGECWGAHRPSCWRHSCRPGLTLAGSRQYWVARLLSLAVPSRSPSPRCPSPKVGGAG